MIHHQIPSQGGWYWIQCVDNGDFMAYLRDEDEPRQIDIFTPSEGGDVPFSSYMETEQGTWDPSCGTHGDLRPILDDHWKGPLCWIGPLSSPFGFQQALTAEFSEELYRKAKKRRLAAVLVHVNYQGCGRSTTTAISAGLLSVAEAKKAAARVFANSKTRTIHDIVF